MKKKQKKKQLNRFVGNIFLNMCSFRMAHVFSHPFYFRSRSQQMVCPSLLKKSERRREEFRVYTLPFSSVPIS